MSEALRAYRAAQDHMGGCGDSNCVIKRPKGQHTNGGCLCLKHPEKLELMNARRLLLLAQRIADELETGEPA